jgi:uncharacterized protein (TIGR03437 family)
VAPGEIVTLFGTGLGPAALATMQPAAGQLDSSLSNTRVLFDGVAAAIVCVSDKQVSAIVPYFTDGQASTRLQVEFQGILTPSVDVPVVPAAPGIFTTASGGTGQGTIFNEDFSANSGENRAAKGSVVMIFGTGEGQTDPPGVDGLIATDVLRKPVQPVTVTIGGQQAEVLYAGSSPGSVSRILQVNARVPDGVAPGAAVPVVLEIGNASSRPGVTMALR